MTNEQRLKEVTAHVRKLIKRDGIKASVSMMPNLGNFGDYYFRVCVPSHGSFFTAEEIRAFCFIAKCNNLTGVRGIEIDIDHEALLTGKQQWNFYLRP